MKKSYITPATVVVNAAPTTVIASSPTATINWEDAVDAGSVEVKGNVHHYDVWEDDWSEENDE